MILEEHRPLALSIARDYYLPGAERKDVEQEAMIALWDAARRYDPSRGPTFKTFAAVVIRRKLMSALRAATRLHHRPLNESERRFWEPDARVWIDVGEATPGGRDPLDVLLERERISELAARVESLSPLERDTIRAVAAGYPADDKRLDNAYQRGKAKLRAAA